MKSKLFKILIHFFALLSISLILMLVVFLLNQSNLFFKDHSFSNFIFGNVWRSSQLNQSFQILNILYASFYIAFVACLICFPIAYATSIFICFYLKDKWQYFFESLINMLAGIPSIVYGFFALFVIVKNIEKYLHLSTGESVLAGALILSFMILPFAISSLCESIRIIKINFEKDSKSLCVSKEFFIRKIVFKKSFFPALTGIILAFSRAIGETMAIMLVIGNAPIFPKLLSKSQTISTLIALEIGTSEVGSAHYNALFSSAVVLLFLVLVINILVFFINRKIMPKII